MSKLHATIEKIEQENQNLKLDQQNCIVNTKLKEDEIQKKLTQQVHLMQDKCSEYSSQLQD